MSSLFIDSLLSGQYPVIAEVKVRASDGTDLMRGRSVAEIANAYRDIGAPCLSVVTGSWFGGAEGMLEDVVREGRRPVLQKDFITKESQICAAADKGAAAVLLTARLLPRAVLCYLAETALRQKLTPFVEVATEKEVDGLRLASDCIVAVNNKDIARRERGAGDLNRSRALLPLVLATGTQCAVSASGIKTPEDGARLIAAGYQGLLVGTSLLKSDDIGAWFAGLSRASAPKEARPMTRYPNKDIRILAAATRRFSCERPEHRLKHGLHTPLSEGVSEAVQAALSKAGAELPEDGTTVGLIGTSRFGELSTLNHVTSRFQAEGIFAIDPVVFSKANQFYTVFATARQFGVTGASSSLFTSDSGAAEGLYYAMQLLRQGDAGHVLVLDAEEDAVASGAPLTGRVCTVLVGPDTREGFGPILSGCALGPHLDTNGRRSSLLKAHLDRRIGMGAAERRHVVVASPSDADTIADLVRSPAVHVEDAPDATAPALASLPGILSTLTSREPGETEVHVVPPTAGNILSVRLRVDGAGRETLT